MIAKRSTKGTDHALSKGGRDFLRAAVAKEARKDGKPVRAAYVVLAEADEYATNVLSLKLVAYYIIQEIEKALKNTTPPELGDFGFYWWIIL